MPQKEVVECAPTIRFADGMVHKSVFPGWTLSRRCWPTLTCGAETLQQSLQVWAERDLGALDVISGLTAAVHSMPPDARDLVIVTGARWAALPGGRKLPSGGV